MQHHILPVVAVFVFLAFSSRGAPLEAESGELHDNQRVILYQRPAIPFTDDQLALVDAKLMAKAEWLTPMTGETVVDAFARLKGEWERYEPKRIDPATEKRETLIAPQEEGGDSFPLLHRGVESVLYSYYSAKLDDPGCTVVEPPQIHASQATGGDEVHCRTGPINVFFYGVGSAWDVQFDLKNWARIPWEETPAQERSAWIGDASHGGADGWIDAYSNSMQPETDTRCFDSRHHIRTWGSVTGDTHGTYGDYTLGAAHYESAVICEHDVISYDDGMWKIAESLTEEDGQGLWFVESLYYLYPGNTAEPDGNGLQLNIEFNA